MPPSSNMAKIESFFNCAAALMTSQLQNLAIDSMRDYTNLISPDPVGESIKTSGQCIFIEWNRLGWKKNRF